MKQARKCRRNISVGVQAAEIRAHPASGAWNCRSMRSRKPGIHDVPPSESAIFRSGILHAATCTRGSSPRRQRVPARQRARDLHRRARRGRRRPVARGDVDRDHHALVDAGGEERIPGAAVDAREAERLAGSSEKVIAVAPLRATRRTSCARRARASQSAESGSGMKRPGWLPAPLVDVPVVVGLEARERELAVLAAREEACPPCRRRTGSTSRRGCRWRPCRARAAVRRSSRGASRRASGS